MMEKLGAVIGSIKSLGSSFAISKMQQNFSNLIPMLNFFSKLAIHLGGFQVFFKFYFIESP